MLSRADSRPVKQGNAARTARLSPSFKKSHIPLLVGVVYALGYEFLLLALNPESSAQPEPLFESTVPNAVGTHPRAATSTRPLAPRARPQSSRTTSVPRAAQCKRAEHGATAALCAVPT